MNLIYTVFIAVVLDVNVLQCELKKSPPPEFFRHFFPKRFGILLVQILHTYYTFLSTLDYKFLSNYLQL